MVKQLLARLSVSAPLPGLPSAVRGGPHPGNNYHCINSNNVAMTSGRASILKFSAFLFPSALVNIQSHEVSKLREAGQGGRPSGSPIPHSLTTISLPATGGLRNVRAYLNPHTGVNGKSRTHSCEMAYGPVKLRELQALPFPLPEPSPGACAWATEKQNVLWKGFLECKK